jgi:hypothetical protein
MALADAGADAGEGAAGVAFEVELSFEGVEDGLDDLAQWFEELLPGAGLLFGAGRPDQVDPEFGEVGLEHLAVVVLVFQQRLALQRVTDPAGQIE